MKLEPTKEWVRATKVARGFFVFIPLSVLFTWAGLLWFLSLGHLTWSNRIGLWIDKALDALIGDEEKEEVQH